MTGTQTTCPTISYCKGASRTTRPWCQSCARQPRLGVTIPFWGPPTTHAEEQEGYDKEELLCMHMTSDEEEQEDYEPEHDSWQISRLVSADTFGAGHDTGDIWTGRMKIM